MGKEGGQKVTFSQKAENNEIVNQIQTSEGLNLSLDQSRVSADVNWNLLISILSDVKGKIEKTDINKIEKEYFVQQFASINEELSKPTPDGKKILKSLMDLINLVGSIVSISSLGPSLHHALDIAKTIFMK